jgi:hypothetical protein
VYAETQTRLATRDLKAQLLKKLKEELVDKMEILNNIKNEMGTAAAESPEAHVRQMEINVLADLAREISHSVELDDIESNAPPRIRKLQSAVLGPDK